MAWLLVQAAAPAEAQPPLQWGDIEPSFTEEEERPAKDEPPSVEVLEVVLEGDEASEEAGEEASEAGDAEARARLDVHVSVAVHGAPRAGEAEAREGEDEPAPRGQHFLVEGSGGLTLSPGLGGASHLLLGAGGRRAGGYLRFYALGGLAHASVGHLEQTDGLRYESKRHHLDIVGGLRIYVPVVGPVRLFTDFLGGGSHVWSTLRGGTFGAYRAQGWRGVFVWAIGLQVRVTRELSVGGRIAVRSGGDPLEDLREHAGIEAATGLSLHLGGTVSWHF